tara:strand:- start:1274 stop:2290 length:1017 start_codon:yes stop_codon:yes gene_type:complete
MSKLLDILLCDEKKVNKQLYSSGPYWKYKTKKATNQIRKKGIDNFRNMNSGVGTSFSDNIILDIRNEYNLLGRIASSLLSLPVMGRIFKSQLKLTSNHILSFLTHQNLVYKNNKRVQDLINTYYFNKTTEFGCVQKFNMNNVDYSCFYLEVANRVDHIRNFIDLKKIRTYLEIGGGYGANIHFLIQNFQNIKKIIYLDIVPNIYVGTEYLKNFYKDAVIDYNQTKKMKEISFSNDDNLQIFCIPPWEIEKIRDEIDHFHSAAAFQEMEAQTVKNYIKYINLNKTKSISLIGHKSYDNIKNFDSKRLNDFFNDKLEIFEYSRVIKELNKNEIYLIKRLN